MAEKIFKKRIFIATLEDSLYIPRYLEPVIREFKEDIAGISIFSPFGEKTVSKGISQKKWALITTRLKYYGIKDFLKFFFRILSFKIIDMFCPLLLKKRKRFFSVKTLAGLYNLNVVPSPTNNINDPDYLKRLRELDIDVTICLIPQIAKEEFLGSSKIGCLNTHCSLLPKNRGREPLFWAIVRKEPVAGVSIHFMEKGLDSGPILKQVSVKIGPKDTLHNLYQKAITKGSEMMIEVLKELKISAFDLIANDDSKATYNNWPEKEDVEKFRKLGRRFF
jgi:folate-dependent phosphoribosylglycinamide formyltransferase PurN